MILIFIDNLSGHRLEFFHHLYITAIGRRDVYKFTKTFTQDGHDLTFEGEYYENDGTFQFGDCVVLNEDGTVNNDIFVLNYVADSEEDAEEFQKMINEIPVDETESK